MVAAGSRHVLMVITCSEKVSEQGVLGLVGTHEGQRRGKEMLMWRSP